MAAEILLKKVEQATGQCRKKQIAEAGHGVEEHRHLSKNPASRPETGHRNKIIRVQAC
jgi:hypothetical protein